MTTKKRKEIAQEGKQLGAEGQDVVQKVTNLENLAELAISTFEDQSEGVTAEAIQSTSKANIRFQSTVEKKVDQKTQEGEEIYDELSVKQENFEQAIVADKADISKLNTLKEQASSEKINSSEIDKAKESKQEEIEFLQKESQILQGHQKELKSKILNSKRRRQAAQNNYHSKSSLNSPNDVRTVDEDFKPCDSLFEEDVSTGTARKQETNKQANKQINQETYFQHIQIFNQKGGHGSQYHGYQTTREQQYYRVMPGLFDEESQKPKRRAKGIYVDHNRREIPLKGSHFLTAESEFFAIKEAEARLSQIPKPQEFEALYMTAQPPGIDAERRWMNGTSYIYIRFSVSSQTGIPILGECCQVVSQSPFQAQWINTNSARFIFRFQSGSVHNEWEPVTYFPE